MTWTESQKTNMQLLLDALAVRAEAKHKRRRQERMERGEGVLPNLRGPMTRKTMDWYLNNFYSKALVLDPDECWNWTAFIQSNGYGQLSILAVRLYAHRVSFFIENGRFPEKDTCHSCDNRRCINPAHLRAGTRSDNMRECVERGRHVPSNRSKLSPEMVLEIRRSPKRPFELAPVFNVTGQTIIDIRNRKTWASI